MGRESVEQFGGKIGNGDVSDNNISRKWGHISFILSLKIRVIGLY